MSLTTVSIISIVSQQFTISTTIIVFILGVIGNSLNILVFTKLKVFQNNQCVFYLLCQSFIDIGLLILTSVLRFLTYRYGSDLSSYFSIWCKAKTMIGQTFLLSSLSVVCLAAIDQFLSTSYSIYLRQRSSLKVARRLVVISTCLSMAHSMIPGIFFDAKPAIDCIPFSPLIIVYYTYIFYPILCGLLPILISGSFSLLACRNVHHIIRRQLPVVRRRLDRQLTQFVLLRVTFLIIFSTPFVLYRIYAFNVIIDPKDLLRVAIERLIQAFLNTIFSLNCAGNFYIFLASSSRYRRQVKQVVMKTCWQQWKRRFHSQHNRIEPATAPPVSCVELE